MTLNLPALKHALEELRFRAHADGLESPLDIIVERLRAEL
jgi:hypothetical protein